MPKSGLKICILSLLAIATGCGTTKKSAHTYTEGKTIVVSDSTTTRRSMHITSNDSACCTVLSIEYALPDSITAPMPKRVTLSRATKNNTYTNIDTAATTTTKLTLHEALHTNSESASEHKPQSYGAAMLAVITTILITIALITLKRN